MAKRKVVQGWPPRWLTPVPAADIKRGDGPLAVDFIESFCRVTKDSIAAPTGSPLVLRPWQQELVGQVLARRPDGRRRHRQALIGMPRKSGKSALLSSLTLYLTFLGPDGGETYAVASSKDQARIVFGDAKRMIQMDAELSEGVRLYRDAIEVVGNGAVMRVLAAEAPQLEGLSPTAVCYDEVHTAPNRELWDVLALAMAARIDPIMVGITTAGVRTDTYGRPTLCYSMYEYGKQVASGELDDPNFFMAWWEPKDPNADHRDPKTWAESNPGFGDLSDPEDFVSSVQRTPEPEFRTKRTNQWVSTMESWLPHGAWDAVNGHRPIEDGAEVVLAFDGSFNGDSTAIVLCEIGDAPHVGVHAAWEKPTTEGQDWQVPIVEVEDAIRAACERYTVREICCDPYRWSRSMQILEDEGLPVVSFPQSAQRMTPATTRFYEAVMNKTLTHDGDVRLDRHVGNATLRMDSRGTRIAKENKHSTRKIDLAVAAIMAVERAAYYSGQSETLPAVFDLSTLEVSDA